MSFQEADHSFGIYIVLMFGRFHWFGFNQESTFKTTCTGIVTGYHQHLSEMFFFTFLIRIQQ